MGLFGLFYAVFAGTSIAHKKIKDSREDNIQKKCSIINGNETYYDHRGVEKLVENDHAILRTTNHKGERIIKDLHTGYVVKNYSDIEKREKVAAVNDKLKKSDSQFRLIGTVTDFYSEDPRFKLIPGNATVYECLYNNKKYLKVEQSKACCHYWIDIDTFEAIGFEFDESRDRIEWCKNYNRIAKNYGKMSVPTRELERLCYQ